MGATFPGGITVGGTTVSAILGDGGAYWQDNKMIILTEDQTELSGGDVTIQAECKHTNGNFHYTDNCDGTHKKACAECGNVIVDNEDHSGGMATCAKPAVCEDCGVGYGYTDYYNHVGETYVQWDWYAYADGTCSVYATLYCADCDAWIDSDNGEANLVSSVDATDCQNPSSNTYSITLTLNGQEYTSSKAFEVKSDKAACSHNWLDATCVDPKTCTKCGTTEGEALGHGHTVGLSYEGNDGLHDVFCDDCDTTIEWNVQCNYDGDFLCDCGNVCPDGIFTDANGDMYYVENGTFVENKGLVQVIDENGLIVYYYFGCGIEGCSAGDACQGNYKAQRSSRHYVGITNGLLPEGGFTFNADGTIEHFDNLQGIQTIDGTKFYLIDGVKVAAGLVEIDGEFYYVRSNGALVIGQDYYVSKPNGLTHNGEAIKKGTYTFDADGKLVQKTGSSDKLLNGIVEEDGGLYYYENGIRTYAGLIIVDGNYYYANGEGQIVRNGQYWITRTNGYMKAGSYIFDGDGVLIFD